MPDGMDACPRCGTVSSPGERFCRQCGFDLAAPAGPISSGEARRRVVELSMGRNVSDEILSPLWIVAPLLAVVVGIAVSAILFFVSLVTGGLMILIVMIVALALFIYLNYKLIERMNRHVAREAALRRALIDYVQARGQERGTAAAVQPYITALESID